MVLDDRSRRSSVRSLSFFSLPILIRKNDGTRFLENEDGIRDGQQSDGAHDQIAVIGVDQISRFFGGRELLVVVENGFFFYVELVNRMIQLYGDVDASPIDLAGLLHEFVVVHLDPLSC